MCTPEARSGPWSTGCDAVVAVQIMSAPRAASEEELAGSTGTPIRCDISCANCLRRVGFRPYTPGGGGFWTAVMISRRVQPLPAAATIAARDIARAYRSFRGTPEV